jgi:CDP-glucose 4,6-dehydratase
VEEVGMTDAFWAGRRTLVTGHTGFKGAWLSLWLAQLGAEITGFALPPAPRPNLFELARVRELVRHHEGDVRDLERLAAVIAEIRPEVIFHLAAQPLVRLSYREPVGTFATNVMGTVHLLEAARTCDSVRAIVCITSDKCYENAGGSRAFSETDPMGGHDPYSSSKGCAELVISAYQRSFFGVPEAGARRVGVASARAGNVVGGGDWAQDRLVPDIVTALSEGRAPEIRNPRAVRPWQHVMEPLRGYLMLAERLHVGGTDVAGGWNFGPQADDTLPVGAIVERLTKLWGFESPWRPASGVHPHEAEHLRLDCTKAASELDWTPRLRLDPALALIVEWHKAHLRGEDMQAVTLEQLRAYELMATPRLIELSA